MDRNGSHRSTAGVWRAIPLLVFGLSAFVACGGEPAADEAAEAPVVEAPAAPAENVIQAEQLQTGAAALRGQVVSLQGAKVVSRLGNRAFFIELPNKNPFLVRSAEGVTADPQQTVAITGTVVAMTSAIITEWVSSGAITENDQPMAEFASDFIDATSVTPATP